MYQVLVSIFQQKNHLEKMKEKFSSAGSTLPVLRIIHKNGIKYKHCDSGRKLWSEEMSVSQEHSCAVRMTFGQFYDSWSIFYLDEKAEFCKNVVGHYHGRSVRRVLCFSFLRMF